MSLCTVVLSISNDSAEVVMTPAQSGYQMRCCHKRPFCGTHTLGHKIICFGGTKSSQRPAKPTDRHQDTASSFHSSDAYPQRRNRLATLGRQTSWSCLVIKPQNPNWVQTPPFENKLSVSLTQMLIHGLVNSLGRAGVLIYVYSNLVMEIPSRFVDLLSTVHSVCHEFDHDRMTLLFTSLREENMLFLHLGLSSFLRSIVQRLLIGTKSN